MFSRHHPSSAMNNTLRLIIATTTAVSFITTCHAWSSSSSHHHHHHPMLFSPTKTSNSFPTTIRPFFVSSSSGGRDRTSTFCSSTKMQANLHGENSCFLPLVQLDQDYFAPRIVQIAGLYPGLTRSEFLSVTSEPSPVQGQWTYEFTNPTGPQVGTVAIEGSRVVAECDDPVAIIAEHTALGVILPPELTEPVELIVLVDRSRTTFKERGFLVLSVPGGEGLVIGGFARKEELPEGSEILGHVVLTQIPWLPAMKPTKTGFLEADEYF